MERFSCRAILVQHFLSMFIFVFIRTLSCAAEKKPEFSSLIVFGDSVVDTGNNNYISSTCKSNHPPYGLHFPGGIPTGRFSDGKIAPDFLASMLGLKETLPPYLQPNLSDQQLITGVNFASACAGLDDGTKAMKGRISMSAQIGYFKDYISRLATIVGIERSQEIANEALVVIHVGSNDLLNHHDENYLQFLLDKMRQFLEEMYAHGLRRVIVLGIPPLGCLPMTMTLFSPLSRNCVDSINSNAQYYNQKLHQLLPQIQANLVGAKFIYVDTFDLTMDIIHHPQDHGLVETERGCCGTGLFEFASLCNILTRPCANSSQYLFWDAVHPSESAHHYLANVIFNVASTNLIS